MKDLSKELRFNQRFKKVHSVETYFRDIYSNRQINRCERIVNRFVGILNKLIREILLHWCYELALS